LIKVYFIDGAIYLLIVEQTYGWLKKPSGLVSNSQGRAEGYNLYFLWNLFKVTGA